MLLPDANQGYDPASFSSTNRLGSVPIEDYGMWGAGAKARTSLALVFRAKEVSALSDSQVSRSWVPYW